MAYPNNVKMELETAIETLREINIFENNNKIDAMSQDIIDSKRGNTICDLCNLLLSARNPHELYMKLYSLNIRDVNMSEAEEAFQTTILAKDEMSTKAWRIYIDFFTMRIVEYAMRKSNIYLIREQTQKQIALQLMSNNQA
jgi:hypothetical protein